MPDGHRAITTPSAARLSRREIADLIRGLFTDPATVSIDAFVVTVNSLYGWCNPADVDAALEIVASQMPSVWPSVPTIGAPN
jgi:hypothetical protein